jgi:predicted nucleotidyltransferase
MGLAGGGVRLAVLFGSRERRDFSAYSDYDLLVVFESGEWRRRKSDELYREVGRTGLFAQVLAISPEEWDKLEPTFKKRVLEQGRIIYLRHPAEAPALAAGLKRVRVLSYGLGV